MEETIVGRSKAANSFGRSCQSGSPASETRMGLSRQARRALLDFLAQVQAPTLSEAGKHISRFFYQVRRRRGENMNSWIVRHDEALFEARRTLAEAIQEYGSKGYSGTRPSTRRSSTSNQSQWETRSTRSRTRPPSVFDEHGRLQDSDEEEEANAEETHDPWTNEWWSQEGWWHYDQGWQESSKAWGTKYDVSNEATEEADRFLPDFVVAWMLLQRSGL